MRQDDNSGLTPSGAPTPQYQSELEVQVPHTPPPDTANLGPISPEDTQAAHDLSGPQPHSNAAVNALPNIPLDEEGEPITSDSDSESVDIPSFVPPKQFRAPKDDQATEDNIICGNFVHRYHLRVAILPTPFALSVITSSNFARNRRRRLSRKGNDGHESDEMFARVTTRMDTTKDKNPYAWVQGESSLGPATLSSGNSSFVRLIGVPSFDTPGEAAEVAQDFLHGKENKHLYTVGNRDILDRHEAKRLQNRLSVLGKDGIFRGWAEKEDGCHVYVKTVAEVLAQKPKDTEDLHGRQLFLVFEQRAVVKPAADKLDETEEDWATMKNEHRSPPSGSMHPSYITAPIQLGMYTSLAAANLCAVSYFREATRPANGRIDDNVFHKYELCPQLDDITYEGIPTTPIDLIFEAWKYPVYDFKFRWIRVSVSRGWVQRPSKREAEVAEEREEMKRLRDMRTRSKHMRLLSEREERLIQREIELKERLKEVERREERFNVRDSHGDVVLSYQM